MIHEDTICAPATSPVNSTLAIIRTSGPETLRVVRSVFSRIDNIIPRMMLYGSIHDDSNTLDDVLLVYYQSPSSFTGEDMAEIFCHGNPLIVRRILNLLQKHGMRMAEPGEFSRRGFLNGKMDLTEAEAINQVILARSEWQIDSALAQMHGSLHKTINSLRDEVVLLRADIEAAIDFSEENIEFISNEESIISIDSITNRIHDILIRCETGEKYSHGIDVILAGRPNVGKSSIMNFLLNEERSIVSDIPGTTRDIIREEIMIDGMVLNLFDTAGIGVPGNEIERIGIERTHQKIRSASLILMILDGSKGLIPEDRQIIDEIADRNRIYVINKSDISEETIIEQITSSLDKQPVTVSAVEGTGMSGLRQALSTIIKENYFDYRDSIVTDIRIIQLLRQSIIYAENTKKLILEKHPPEIIAFEMMSLLNSLKEITGEISPEDVLDSIFSRFCIGK